MRFVMLPSAVGVKNKGALGPAAGMSNGPAIGRRASGAPVGLPAASLRPALLARAALRRHFAVKRATKQLTLAARSWIRIATCAIEHTLIATTLRASHPPRPIEAGVSEPLLLMIVQLMDKKSI